MSDLLPRTDEVSDADRASDRKRFRDPPTIAWMRAENDAGKPYTVSKVHTGDWWHILDRNGVNVLRAAGKSWEHTDEQTATELARMWNE